MTLREAEAGLTQAQAQYRELTLFDDRSRTPGALGARAHRTRALGPDVAEVRLERAQLDLSRTIARAPFEGRVASIERSRASG